MDKMEVKSQVHGEESWRDDRSFFFMSKPSIENTSVELVKQKTTVLMVQKSWIQPVDRYLRYIPLFMRVFIRPRWLFGFTTEVGS